MTKEKNEQVTGGEKAGGAVLVLLTGLFPPLWLIGLCLMIFNFFTGKKAKWKWYLLVVVGSLVWTFIARSTFLK